MESNDSMQDDVFREVAGRAQTHCTRSWRCSRPFTTIKSNEMKPMNLQEEVKKLDEQESAVSVASPIGGGGELGHPHSRAMLKT